MNNILEIVLIKCQSWLERHLMIIHIRNLRLRTIIGINEWERKKPQDIIINISVEFDGDKAAQSDAIEDTVNYKTMTKKIITLIESSQHFLLERLADRILDLIMGDVHIRNASVTIDKPNALRFADSVAIEASRTR
jgi:D-erythro-7,8-dihydroneopterin triphosphate epimerase